MNPSTTLSYQSEFGSLTNLPAFSAYNFLRNCNYFLENPSQGNLRHAILSFNCDRIYNSNKSFFVDVHLKAYRDTATLNYKSTNHDPILSHQENDNAVDDLLPKNLFSHVNLLSYSHPLQLLRRDSTGNSKKSHFKSIINENHFRCHVISGFILAQQFWWVQKASK